MRRRQWVVVVFAVIVSGCWTQYGGNPSGTGYQPLEFTLSQANVGQLTTAWTGHTGTPVSSPAVANGVAYIGANDHKLYAFDAAGVNGCSGSPKKCTALWTATLIHWVTSSPAVADGVVYAVSGYGGFGQAGYLYAFDAAGVAGCSGSPKTCTPLWTASIPGAADSSPRVVNGVVYVSSVDGTLYAFGTGTGSSCSGTPKSCSPLWTAQAGNVGGASPVVANGVVYIGSSGVPFLYAFDAGGVVGCSGSPKTCQPLWTGPLPWGTVGSPTVAEGRVFVATGGDRVYGFDAGGVVGCSGSPKTCTSVWSAAGVTGPNQYLRGPPAVANGVLYIGSYDATLYAFDTTGTTNCSGTPVACTPLWKTTTAGAGGSSASIANGLVFVGSEDAHLYAFDANGVTNCSGAPKRCAPLWSALTGDGVYSSPAIVNGTVYVGSADRHLYAFSLPT